MLYKTAFLYRLSLALVATKVNIKEAEILQQAGVLETPVTKKQTQGGGWTVTMKGKHKLNPILETARGQVRVFKRLDAAVSVLFEIGFDEIKIVQ